MRQSKIIQHSLVLFSLFSFILAAKSQDKSITGDKKWSGQFEVVKNTIEADLIIRIGDVDNLGFGWPEGFDPFCGRMTEAHYYPWDAKEEDLPGFDRILLSSKFNPAAEHACGADGYSNAFDKNKSKPVTYAIPVTAAKSVTITNAWLQIFIDDFQSPTFCSRFQVFINNTRVAELEKLLNAIDQTGPVGKLISFPLPEEFYPAILSGNNISFKIDESTGAADGFAIDFIRLLINRKRENTCKGNINGNVIDKETGAPIQDARVYLSDKTSVISDKEGRFTIKDIPTGFEVVNASANGYNDGAATADIGTGDENPSITIALQKGKTALFNEESVRVGDAVSLNNILFDQGKSDLKPPSLPELDKVVAFMNANVNAEIELSGHTSAEGEAVLNRSLSYKRVKSCKDYLISKGIDAGRIIATGYGPDRPVAPNTSEENRAKNRRVEMRIARL
jgi:outer membrane protein OmpA-like peptidoglycan-associated protein